MPAHQPPRAPRRQVFGKAHLLIEGEWVEVSLANVSATGVMVKFPGGLPVGTRIELRRRGLAIAGEVVWSTSTRFGVRSFEEIDQSALLDTGLQPKVAEKPLPARKRIWHWRSRD